MIRLEICGEGDANVRAVFAHLRGVLAATPEDAEAAVLLGGLDLLLIAEDLLSRGRHVLITVEAVDSLSALDRLVLASQRGGSRLAVVNPQHYQPSRRLIKEQLGAGQLGAVGLVRLRRWEKHRGRTLALPPMRLLGDLEEARWLVGCLPEVLYAAGSPDASFLQVHLGFPGGAMALVDFTAQLPSGDEYRSLSVIGSSGAAYADDHQNVQLHFQGGAAQARRAGGGVLHLSAMVQAFLDGVVDGSDFASGVATWRAMLQVAPAVRESLRVREAIRLEEPAG